jgi:hypothetical protein
VHGQVLFVKQWHVKRCMGLSEAVARVNSPAHPVHLFHDLKLNRKGVSQVIKQSQSRAVSSLLSDDENSSLSSSLQSFQCPVKSTVVRSLTLKCHNKDEPAVVGPRSKRKRISTSLSSEDIYITNQSIREPRQLTPYCLFLSCSKPSPL